MSDRGKVRSTGSRNLPASSMADATWRRLDGPAAIAKVRAHVLGSAERYPTLGTSGFGLDWILDQLLGPS
ncbi:hypothetical protein ABZ342_40520 [Amycolatopsis sp. NPDC005961]|uniref:hypothetical protein n=1 Tax=Amycolatopsis sp. NPDC005961 TaxID=3156720 RepID=UPI0034091C01